MRIVRQVEPRGGEAGPVPDESRTMIRFVDCMRSHGVPNFPDPDAPRRVQECVRHAVARVQARRTRPASTCSRRRPAEPELGAQSSANRRDAGVRPLHAQPRVPELPRPDQQRPVDTRDARQRGDKLATAGVLQAADACVSVTHGVITRASVARFPRDNRPPIREDPGRAIAQSRPRNTRGGNGSRALRRSRDPALLVARCADLTGVRKTFVF